MIDLADRELARFEELRTWLVADVVTGKLDIREVAGRPAEEPEESEESEPMNEWESDVEDTERTDDLDNPPGEGQELNVRDGPKLYHIVHVDRLPSIANDGFLWCDAEVLRRRSPGTGIGMSVIKERRLSELQLASRPGLYVGQCVPFYFCPRPVMLYLLHRGNHPALSYRGGQAPIVHLVADLDEVVQWAESEGLRWAFTLSNAGSYYFEDRCDLARLHEVDWDAVQARDWRECKEGKQAEFLVEHRVPWRLVQSIGVYSQRYLRQVRRAVNTGPHRPVVAIRRAWYY